MLWAILARVKNIHVYSLVHQSARLLSWNLSSALRSWNNNEISKSLSLERKI